MLIVGTKPAQHDACFALVRDGEPLFIYEQERFNRVKHGMSSHLGVLFEALDEYGIAPGDVDLVTNCIDPSRLEERKRQGRTYLDELTAAATDEHLEWRVPTWHQILVAAGFPARRVVDIRHHLCHAAGVYYASAFNDAAVLSVDGSGETETAMMAHGRDGEISVLRTTPHPHSLGHLYQAATMWLGWGFGEEGKTMALAAYGEPRRYRDRLDEIISVDADGKFRFAPVGSGWSAFRYTSHELAADLFTSMFGPARAPAENITQHHRDVAAAVQNVCDDIMLRSARWLHAVTGSTNLLLAGGVGLNSVSNGLIMREGLFDRVVAYPQANDAGTALGGALYAYHRLCGQDGRTRRWSMRHPYWGREIDTDQLEDVARRHGVTPTRPDDVVAASADLLAEGAILGWVQGRAEIGPRALGNRSILGHPLHPGIKDSINARVKHREQWRPFAPSVLREDLATYFEADQDLPYMTVVAQLRKEWRQPLASIGHVDGTARVQTVTEESNPRFHKLLRKFKALTGLGMLLNTSFNDRGEPLVQTCDQAIRLYLASAMDALVIGDHLFTTKPAAGLRNARSFSPLLTNAAKLPTERVVVLGDVPADAEWVVDGMDRAPANLADDLDALRSVYDAVVVFVDRPAEAAVFDRDVYFSPMAATARRIMEQARLPVYWIDSNGDVTPMRDVLYVHHQQPTRCALPSTYDCWWRRPDDV